MSSPNLRIGMTSKDGRRPPGVGGHVGLFHLVKVGANGGRIISVGYLRLDRRDLEPLRDKGHLKVTAIGVLRLGPDVSPALAQSVLRVRVIGRMIGDPRTTAAC